METATPRCLSEDESPAASPFRVRVRWCLQSCHVFDEGPTGSDGSNVSASRGPFRFFWTTECEAAHAIRFGHFLLPGNDIGQALRGNDGEEKRDGTDNSRAAGRLPRETRDGRQRWQWGATAEHLGDH